MRTLKSPTAADYLHWDVQSWLPALRYWEQAVDWSRVHSAVEIGGERGGLSLWMAQKGVPNVWCTNLQNTEALAKPHLEKWPAAQNIQFRDLDATQLPHEPVHDVVIFKSVLGGAGRGMTDDELKTLFHSFHNLLKSGGVLLFAENLSASRLHRFARKHFVSWGESWKYPSKNLFDSFLEDIDEYKLCTTGFLATFGRSESQRRFLAKLDQGGVQHVVPASWRYIAYGSVTKSKR